MGHAFALIQPVCIHAVSCSDARSLVVLSEPARSRHRAAGPEKFSIVLCDKSGVLGKWAACVCCPALSKRTLAISLLHSDQVSLTG